MNNPDTYINKKAFTDLLIGAGYEFIGNTYEDDWEYQPGIYTEKAFGRHIVCYDPEQKIYYCKIKRNED
jgi:hypothetical protein